ncbi:MAG: response regulator [Deltaproteobacteria bacterium]|nr:response regulator [Deltaproteobacteria bacterium]
MKILVAEDNPVIAELLNKTLTKDGYRVVLADNGQKAWELFQEQRFKMVISDWMMPEMDGITLCNKIRAEKLSHYVYIILQTTRDQLPDTLAGFKAGVDDYISKPYHPEEIRARIRSGLRIIELEQKVLEEKNEILKKHKELEESYMDIIRLLSSLIEMLNPVLGEYMKHAGRLSRETAEALGLEKELADQIEIAGLFHDIGLLGLPELMLLKDEIEMDKTELGLYTQHPLIASLSFEAVKRLSGVSGIILSHHENFDGSGFPNGLKESQIPIGARIVAAVSDYCKIIHTWPAGIEEIKKRAADNFGREITENCDSNDPDTLNKQIAKKALEIGSNSKYDADVVEKLIKITGKTGTGEGREWVAIKDLKEGMELAKELCLKDGRHLLSNGVVLNAASIGSIQKLKDFNVLDDRIFVTYRKLSV